ncbi:hypothetical protein DTO013E5_9791 [Penicillium roqueforti]|nr:uncharacterized protein LCP9604111_8759 [Penicillium roqueforti]KAF9240584.1 hypothetical protein LCP9604111_8759 [Penicillium roqueforti]KAI1829085.1 hypothetical protein CBS147337_10106 [Penicillium roqueforti]KAI2674531.1 hypothetical protein CBS147355_7145 [Penicillium roqueforti]KAI2683809.1 hypothetical protein LCP963914a_5639 [Penicillium roqueforti]KAI2694591.1 hypothetical protein CBS147372_9714 [Penicillium roqueforti]
MSNKVCQAEPVQYCQFGHHDAKEDKVNFRLGVSTHFNSSSTTTHDIYLSLSITRDSDLGWTAIGTGSLMAGSLMFILYGDPESSENPVLSIRTVDGHHQPRLITHDDMGGADLRLLQTSWMSALPSMHHEQHTIAKSQRPQSAHLSLICYSCARWPTSPISPLSSSQPWIRAWNNQQKFPMYSFDAPLDMYAHHVGNGGWVRFYVDMARSLTQPGDYYPSFPPLRPNIEALGASDTPIGISGIAATAANTWRKVKATALLQMTHGIMMAGSFLFLLPVGVLALRSGSPRSFTYHWILQGLATTCMIVGAGTGIALNQAHEHGHSHNKRHDSDSAKASAIFNTHQFLGGMIVAFLLIQILLGWWHHVTFVRIRARTWVSYAHIWVGRMEMVGGCANLLIGMVLTGCDSLGIEMVAGFILMEALGVTFWCFYRQQLAARKMSNA